MGARKIADAFRILIDKTGQLFQAEGNIGVIRAHLPEDIKNGSIYDFFPEADHTPVSKILDSVTNNTEGRISDIAVLTSSGTEPVPPDRQAGRRGPVVVRFRGIQHGSRHGTRCAALRRTDCHMGRFLRFRQLPDRLGTGRQTDRADDAEFRGAGRSRPDGKARRGRRGRYARRHRRP